MYFLFAESLLFLLLIQLGHHSSQFFVMILSGLLVDASMLLYLFLKDLHFVLKLRR